MNIIERVIGPLPIGDVDSMRRLASELRHRATEIRGHADKIHARQRAMVFGGPAADRFGSFVEHESNLVRAIADELDGQAAVLEAEARETAGAQQAWHRRADRIKGEVKRIEGAGERAWDNVDRLRRSIFR